LLSMTDQAEQHGISYASAGVDIEAGDRAVELFKPLAKKATRPEVRGGLGGFAGLFALRGGYREPVLASSTDGVGTKLAVAQAMDKHDTVGIDLVAAPSRCSCRTTSQSAARCPNGSANWCQASPTAA
jgi:phosphoribosylformylglycinamidine cyclo-ligase